MGMAKRCEGVSERGFSFVLLGKFESEFAEPPTSFRLESVFERRDECFGDLVIRGMREMICETYKRRPGVSSIPTKGEREKTKGRTCTLFEPFRTPIDWTRQFSPVRLNVLFELFHRSFFSRLLILLERDEEMTVCRSVLEVEPETRERF